MCQRCLLDVISLILVSLELRSVENIEKTKHDDWLIETNSFMIAWQRSN